MTKTWISIALFCSGLNALIYQICWQKYLSYLVGSESRSICLVVSIFLLGLAIGYHFWGKFSQRYTFKADLYKNYAYIEFGLSLYACLYPFYFLFLKKIVFVLPQFFLIDLLVTILSLGLPTFLMGATIPFVTQAYPDEKEDLNKDHAFIYGLNTIGAFLGVWAGCYLIPKYGLSTTLTISALFNFLVGLIFFLQRPKGMVIQSKDAISIKANLPEKSLFFLSFAAGCISIGLELLLIRSLGLAIGMNYLVFPIILSIFIFSLGIGSIKVSQKENVDIHFLFRKIIYSLLFLGILAASIPFWPMWISYFRIGLKELAQNVYVYYSFVYLLIFIFIFPAISNLGSLLPLSYYFLNKNSADFGAKCGKIYAINTLGTFIGSVFFGYILFYAFNLEFLVKFLVCMGLGVLAYLTVRQKYVLGIRNILVILLSLGLLFFPWDRSHHFAGIFGFTAPNRFVHNGNLLKITPANFLIEQVSLKDGPNTTVSVGKLGDLRSIYVNGKCDGTTNYKDDMTTMKSAAFLPYLYTSGEKLKTAVVGIGTGVTAGLMGAFDQVSEVDVMEISREVIKAAPFFDPDNWEMTKNKKIKIHEIDAFKFFNSNNKNQYDIIASEPSNPWMVGTENLFTPDFYQLVSQNLKKTGVFAQWYNGYNATPESFLVIIKNLASVFPHVMLYQAAISDFIFIASHEELRLKNLSNKWSTPLLTTVMGNIHLNYPDTLLFHEVFTTNDIRKIAKYDFPYEHSLDQPTLSFRLLTPLFLRSQIGKRPLGVSQFYRTNDEKKISGKQRVLRDKKIHDECEQDPQKDKVTICSLMKKYYPLLERYQTNFEPIEQLKIYSVLREARLLAKDKDYLVSIGKNIFKPINKNIAKQAARLLIGEFMMDGLETQAYDFAHALFDQGVVSQMEHNFSLRRIKAHFQ